jgi:hypothetical protein
MFSKYLPYLPYLPRYLVYTNKYLVLRNTASAINLVPGNLKLRGITTSNQRPLAPKRVILQVYIHVFFPPKNAISGPFPRRRPLFLNFRLSYWGRTLKERSLGRGGLAHCRSGVTCKKRRKEGGLRNIHSFIFGGYTAMCYIPHSFPLSLFESRALPYVAFLESSAGKKKGWFFCFAWPT